MRSLRHNLIVSVAAIAVVGTATAARPPKEALRVQRDADTITRNDLRRMPRHPPPDRGQQTLLPWLRQMIRTWQLARAQARRGQRQAAAQTCFRIRRECAAVRSELSVCLARRYFANCFDLGAAGLLVTLARTPAQAERLRRQADSVETAVLRFLKECEAFEADVSWRALTGKWFDHADPQFRLLAAHAAALGAANNVAGYKMEHVISRLRRMTKEDPDQRLIEQVTKYIEWLEPAE